MWRDIEMLKIMIFICMILPISILAEMSVVRHYDISINYQTSYGGEFLNIVSDADSNVWITTASNGLLMYNNIEWTDFSDLFGNSNFGGIIPSKNGDVWIPSGDTLYHYDKDGVWKIYSYANDFKTDYPQSLYSINNVVFDKYGNTFVVGKAGGKSKAFFKFDGVRWVEYLNFHDFDYNSDGEIVTISARGVYSDFYSIKKITASGIEVDSSTLNWERDIKPKASSIKLNPDGTGWAFIEAGTLASYADFSACYYFDGSSWTKKSIYDSLNHWPSTYEKCIPDKIEEIIHISKDEVWVRDGYYWYIIDLENKASDLFEKVDGITEYNGLMQRPSTIVNDSYGVKWGLMGEYGGVSCYIDSLKIWKRKSFGRAINMTKGYDGSVLYCYQDMSGFVNIVNAESVGYGKSKIPNFPPQVNIVFKLSNGDFWLHSAHYGDFTQITERPITPNSNTLIRKKVETSIIQMNDKLKLTLLENGLVEFKLFNLKGQCLYNREVFVKDNTVILNFRKKIPFGNYILFVDGKRSNSYHKVRFGN